MEHPQGYKLLLSYHVSPENQQAYHQFVMSQYLPTMQSMGFQMSEAWHTAYGNAPNRLVGLVCNDEEAMNELLQSDSWESLIEQLEELVSDLDYKFIPYRGGFQL